MSSQIEICNLSLIKFGDVTITDINDTTSKEARSLKAIWNIKRDELLKKFPWNFAMARADLGAHTTTTPLGDEYDYEYSLPSGCLRVWKLFSGSKFVVEGNKLLTNDLETDDSVIIQYIKQITDISLYTSEFCICFAFELAIELAPKLAGEAGKAMRELLKKEYLIYQKEAYRLNAFEGNPFDDDNEKPVDEGLYTWQKEGR